MTEAEQEIKQVVRLVVGCIDCPFHFISDGFRQCSFDRTLSLKKVGYGKPKKCPLNLNEILVRAK